MTDIPTVGRDVEVEVKIVAPPEAVFAFFVEPEKLTRWMGTACDIEPRPGGRLWCRLSDDDVVDGHYIELDPPHRLVFSWGWVGSENVPPGSSTITVELTPEGDSTTLRLTQSGLPSDVVDTHEQGWDYYLPRLMVAATGGEPTTEESP